MTSKKKILVTTSEKNVRESYARGFTAGKETGRKEALEDLRILLGIDQVIGDIKQEIEDNRCNCSRSCESCEFFT